MLDSFLTYTFGLSIVIDKSIEKSTKSNFAQNLICCLENISKIASCNIWVTIFLALWNNYYTDQPGLQIVLLLSWKHMSWSFIKRQNSSQRWNCYSTRYGYFIITAILSLGWDWGGGCFESEVEVRLSRGWGWGWGWDEIELKFSWSWFEVEVSWVGVELR